MFISHVESADTKYSLSPLSDAGREPCHACAVRIGKLEADQRELDFIALSCSSFTLLSALFVHRNQSPWPPQLKPSTPKSGQTPTRTTSARPVSPAYLRTAARPEEYNTLYWEEQYWQTGAIKREEFMLIIALVIQTSGVLPLTSVSPWPLSWTHKRILNCALVPPSIRICIESTPSTTDEERV